MKLRVTISSCVGMRYNLYTQGVTEYVRPAWKADRTPSKQ